MAQTPTRVGPFATGIDNVSKETELTPKQLRDAVNVDLSADGWPRRRPGYAQVYAGAGVHSLRRLNGHYLVVDGGWLCTFNPVSRTTTQIKELRDTTSRMEYTVWGADVYFSNGTDTGRLVGPTPILRPMALPTPPPPVVSVSAGTFMVPGTYSISVTYVAPDGVESGASELSTVTLAEGQVFSLSAIAQPPTGFTADVWVYATPVDGDTFYHAKTVAQGTTSWTPTSPLDQGQELRTRHLRPMPAGSIVRYYGGRLFMAHGRQLVFSQPLRPGLYNPAEDYFLYPEEISVVEPVEDGVFVVADRTYFLRGREMDQLSQTDILPIGAVPGTGLPVDGKKFDLKEPISTEAAFWFSDRGAVLGAAGGRVVQLMENRAEPGEHESGTSYFIERDGSRMVGSVLSKPGPTSGFVATDSATAVIRRNGVIIG